MLKEAMKEKEINVVLLSSLDRRQTNNRIDEMKRCLKGVSTNIRLIASDSGEFVMSKTGYLPGGTLSILTGQIVGMV